MDKGKQNGVRPTTRHSSSNLPDMTKQEKYRILANTENYFIVLEIETGAWPYEGGYGKAGLENCEEWLAKQPEE